MSKYDRKTTEDYYCGVSDCDNSLEQDQIDICTECEKITSRDKNGKPIIRLFHKTSQKIVGSNLPPEAQYDPRY